MERNDPRVTKALDLLDDAMVDTPLNEHNSPRFAQVRSLLCSLRDEPEGWS